MTVSDHISAHQLRCEHLMLRLRALARTEPGAVISRHVVAAEVRDATNAVIAEAEAAGRYVLAASGGDRQEPHAEMFLWVRLARLGGAAEEAVSAARDGDAARLLRELRRFDALTSAIWTVQRAVYGQEPTQGREPAQGEDLVARGGRTAGYW